MVVVVSDCTKRHAPFWHAQAAVFRLGCIFECEETHTSMQDSLLTPGKMCIVELVDGATSIHGGMQHLLQERQVLLLWCKVVKNRRQQALCLNP